jgi:hypothetical protein
MSQNGPSTTLRKGSLDIAKEDEKLRCKHVWTIACLSQSDSLPVGASINIKGSKLDNNQWIGEIVVNCDEE